jgi:hypothetical protein
MPKARSLGVAASILALNLPDGLVKASRVVAGDRSVRMSSVRRWRVGDRVGEREDALVCFRGVSWGTDEASIMLECLRRWERVGDVWVGVGTLLYSGKHFLAFFMPPRIAFHANAHANVTATEGSR